MTQDDLERRINSMRRFGIASVTGCGILGIGPLLFFLTCDLLKKHPVDNDTELILIAGGVFLFFPLLGILAYWGQYRYRVLCPKCRQSLVEQYPKRLSMNWLDTKKWPNNSLESSPDGALKQRFFLEVHGKKGARKMILTKNAEQNGLLKFYK